MTKNWATVVNARVMRGHIVFIACIGGGVALLALRLCLALGAHVYVTSSSDTKIARAVARSAAGGVNYTHSQYGFSLP
jgi:D-arabinose 1-dehydrogenase-like Zn-dependent alcohol dehydrogenase